MFKKKFGQYERLRERSGFVLKADKTKILVLHTDSILKYDVTYNFVRLTIPTVSKLKICGSWYSSSAKREY